MPVEIEAMIKSAGAFLPIRPVRGVKMSRTCQAVSLAVLQYGEQ